MSFRHGVLVVATNGGVFVFGGAGQWHRPALIRPSVTSPVRCIRQSKGHLALVDSSAIHIYANNGTRAGSMDRPRKKIRTEREIVIYGHNLSRMYTGAIVVKNQSEIEWIVNLNLIATMSNFFHLMMNLRVIAGKHTCTVRHPFLRANIVRLFDLNDEVVLMADKRSIQFFNISTGKQLATPFRHEVRWHTTMTYN